MAHLLYGQRVVDTSRYGESLLSVLLGVVAITLFVSAVCSLFEATLYSTRLATLESARDKGKHQAAAEIFWRMKQDVTAPTSAILILNTIANTAGATVAGMLAAKEFGSGYVPLFSAILTLGILMLSEIIPKTYGAVHWRGLWPFVAWPLATFIKVLSPLVWLTRKFSNLLIPKNTAPGTTGDEVLSMIRIAANSGELTPLEHELLTAVFNFDNVVCREVMVPRSQVVFLKKSWTLGESLASIRDTLHTRYPVVDDSFDTPIGIVHVKDLLGLDESTVMSTIVRPVRMVTETMPIPRLLREMQSCQDHMALVIDEHGSTVGIITLENVLEQIVGSVQDEFDAEEPEILPNGTRCYLVRGATPIARVNLLLGTSLPHPSEVDTTAGLLVRELGRLLEVGDTVKLGLVSIEVIEVVGNQATQLQLTMLDPSDEEEE